MIFNWLWICEDLRGLRENKKFPADFTAGADLQSVPFAQ
jgi:hypothetical protein